MAQNEISSSGDNLLKSISTWPDDLIYEYMVKHRQPQFLYKYCSFTNPQHVEDIICNSKLWLSGVKKLNDPFEFNWTTTISSNPADRINKARQLAAQFPDAFGKTPEERNLKILEMALSSQLEESLKQMQSKSDLVNPGVACFTTNPFEILMWAHYANQFKGCVFQFEVIKDVQVFMQALPVRYSKIYPTVEFTNISDQKELNQAMLSKYIGWQYEAERRILRLYSGESELQFKPVALSGIYLGCNFESANLKVLDELLNKRKFLGWRTPEVINTKIDISAYEIKVV